MKKSRVYPAKSGALLAAVLAGSLLVAATVYAVYLSGLRDIQLGKENVLDLSGRAFLPDEITETDIPVKEVSMISLGGIVGSPEYMAGSEWREFLQSYDMDGTILAEIGNGFAGLGEYELIYNCYTQEMADEVDRLCEKYGLARLKGFYLAEDYESLCKRAGIGDLCRNAGENVKWSFYDGCLHDDGTFQMDGRVAWKNSLLYVTDYQFVRTVKGSFNPFTLNVGEIEEYHEWNYTTGNGQNVLLANSDTKALIVLDGESSFIVVNVLGNIASNTFEVSDEMLEELADIFDFSAIP